MEIRKLFGQDAVKDTNAKKSRAEVEKTEADAQGAAANAAAGGDVVSVSKLSRQLLQVSDIVEDDRKKQADRVADLKRNVEDGTYSVSSSDVAASFLSYAAEVPPVREI